MLTNDMAERKASGVDRLRRPDAIQGLSKCEMARRNRNAFHFRIGARPQSTETTPNFLDASMAAKGDVSVSAAFFQLVGTCF